MLKDILKMITGIIPPTQAFVPSKYAGGGLNLVDVTVALKLWQDTCDADREPFDVAIISKSKRSLLQVFNQIITAPSWAPSFTIYHATGDVKDSRQRGVAAALVVYFRIQTALLCTKNRCCHKQTRPPTGTRFHPETTPPLGGNHRRLKENIWGHHLDPTTSSYWLAFRAQPPSSPSSPPIGAVRVPFSRLTLAACWHRTAHPHARVMKSKLIWRDTSNVDPLAFNTSGWSVCRQMWSFITTGPTDFLRNWLIRQRDFHSSNFRISLFSWNVLAHSDTPRTAVVSGGGSGL